MARPTKEGLDYFPLDVDIDQDDKVSIIIAKHGMEGFGVLIKLLMKIYKDGYSYPWTEKEQIIFSSGVNVNINKVNEIINDCVKWGFFHQKTFEEQEVLTSKGIQERYLLATSRRVNVDINEKLKLVSVDINSNSSQKQSTKSTQSKRKEIRVDKTKEEKAENAFSYYEKNFGLLSSKVSETVGYWLDQFESKDEIIIEAMKIAELRNKRNFGYVEGILKDWKNKNAKTLEDCQGLQAEFKTNIGTHTKQNKVTKTEEGDLIENGEYSQDYSKYDFYKEREPKF